MCIKSAPFGIKCDGGDVVNLSDLSPSQLKAFWDDMEQQAGEMKDGFLYKEPGKEYTKKERIEALEKEVLFLRRLLLKSNANITVRLRKLEA